MERTAIPRTPEMVMETAILMVEMAVMAMGMEMGMGMGMGMAMGMVMVMVMGGKTSEASNPP